MAEAKVEIQSKTKTITLIQAVSILGIAILAPLFPIQGISGPIVNALLIIATIFLGWRNALVVCLIPSLMALLAGLLPIVLAPIVPFIMASNIILVVVFSYYREKNYWLAVGLASFIKFVFIWSTTYIMARFVLHSALAIKVVSLMMGWMQLASALAGGVIAYIFLKAIKRF